MRVMRSKRATLRQQELEFRTWGGARIGAGRKPAGDRQRAPHAAREEVRPYQPVHVSMRMAPHVWNLRSQRSFRVIDAAIRRARRDRGFRVAHFTILGNHLHLVVEANGTRAFTRGVRALAIRVARGLNCMMGRTGPVFADRYDAHVLRTPAEVRNAVRYVLGNFESHAVRRGELRSTTGWVDPFSSAAARGPREERVLDISGRSGYREIGGGQSGPAESRVAVHRGSRRVPDELVRLRRRPLGRFRSRNRDNEDVPPRLWGQLSGSEPTGRSNEATRDVLLVPRRLERGRQDGRLEVNDDDSLLPCRE